MHLSHRSPVSTHLSMITLLSIIGAMLVTVVSYRTTYATTKAMSAQYHGTPGKATHLSTSRPPLLNGPLGGRNHMIPLHGLPHPVTTALSSSLAVNDAGFDKAEGSLLHNFNDLSDADQAVVNGGISQGYVSPPDQGLCVGYDPGVPVKVVFEAINNALRETSVKGTTLPGTPLLGNTDVSFTSFWEPGALADPRCFYDPSSRTFFFTVVGNLQSGPDQGKTSIDLAIFNALGFVVYQIDSSFGGIYSGDQPHVGYDNTALYLSTDEFNEPFTAYFGSALWVVSKSQLVKMVPSPAWVRFGPLILGGVPILTLQPAVSTTSTSTEYLLNSFPFADAAITPNPISYQLGLWTLRHDIGVTTGNPDDVTLTGTIIRSEGYGFPVNAVSTGTGIATNGITSQAFLNPNDSRMQQVQCIKGQLWAALTTSISINNTPHVRDGIAWFNIDAAAGKVASQGYIASQGNYLIYPAIIHTVEGMTAITFTITSTSIHPSAAYVVRKSAAIHFGVIHIVASGSGPYLSIAGTPSTGPARWGDYSSAVLDPNGMDIWSATEYIPLPRNQDPFDNWGTRVFDTQGDS